MDGKQRVGACGHIQRAVIAQFYLCEGAANCDGKPVCRKCGSRRVAPFVSEQTPPGSMHCWACGAV